MEKFVAHGLMKKEYEKVKIHASLMNSKLRTESEDKTPAKNRTDLPPRFTRKVSFDARKIVSVSRAVKMRWLPVILPATSIVSSSANFR